MGLEHTNTSPIKKEEHLFFTQTRLMDKLDVSFSRSLTIVLMSMKVIAPNSYMLATDN